MVISMQLSSGSAASKGNNAVNSLLSDSIRPQINHSRRLLLLGATTTILPFLPPHLPAASAAPLILPNKEVDDATSPLIQDLLKKTVEKKDERYRERLDNYYKRNFQDYFNFEMGNRDGVSAETKAEVKAWLEKNK
jgi:hypothetical protein